MWRTFILGASYYSSKRYLTQDVATKFTAIFEATQPLEKAERSERFMKVLVWPVYITIYFTIKNSYESIGNVNSYSYADR